MTQRFAFCPWQFREKATPQEREQQRAFHDRLVATGRFALGEDAYVSPLAGIEVTRLALGARSFVGGFAYLSHDVAMGADCSINPFAVVRGRVRAGNGVRIASHASVVGFNHRSEDTSTAIHDQGEISKGIAIGDDVWIGANAVVVDGVRIGSHAIVAAGAVVTRDVAEWQIVGGNPARPLRDRRGATQDGDARPAEGAPHDVAPAAPVRRPVRESIATRLASFGARVAEQWPAIVARCRADRPEGIAFVDRPGAKLSGVRPLADAVEIAAMFGALPPALERDALVAQFQAAQDPASGMPFDPWRRPREGYAWDAMGDIHTAYMVLSAGYALECLGATFRAPIAGAHRMPPERMAALMNALPWREQAWAAGAWIDSLGTALAINRVRFGLDGPVATLFELLAQHCQPHTGLWGQPDSRNGWLQPVNGAYRIVRGTYAQFGRRVPHPESAVDTLHAHIRQFGDFAERGVDACNVLDVVHPIRFLGGATAHRRDEGLAFIERQVPRILARWVDGAGFGFAAADAPGLQGTEMWLAIVATAADALGEGATLGFSPRGVHRLDPFVRDER
ncbi:Maltose O-acetyltransferase [Burkholderiales bacterium]|nr:Maltose O-acetyltransferase [Burkholderiales bacterium]